MKISEKESPCLSRFLTLKKKKKKTLTLNSLENVRARARGKGPHRRAGRRGQAGRPRRRVTA